MNQKIILLAVFSFFIALFLPTAYVSADAVFIGVTIDSAVRADGVSPFCLPNGTNISIIGNVSSNSKSTTSTACAGQTMWSDLVTLASGSNYSVKLDAPNCYGPYIFNFPWQEPGHTTWRYDYSLVDGAPIEAKNNVDDNYHYPNSISDDQNPALWYSTMPSGGAIIDARDTVKAQNNGNPQCWIQGDKKEDCVQACATAGLSRNGNCTQADPNCAMVGYFLRNKNIRDYNNRCDDDSSPYGSMLSTIYGYRSGNNSNVNRCIYGSSFNYRLCPCSYNINSFSFPFTPVF